MYRYRKRLEALFHVFDKDGNGKITLDEFKAGIDILNAHLPDHYKPFTNAPDLMRSLDFTHDNEININEFMECFRIHANWTVQDMHVYISPISNLGHVTTKKACGFDLDHAIDIYRYIDLFIGLDTKPSWL